MCTWILGCLGAWACTWGTWVCTWVLGYLGAWVCTWGAAGHIMRRVDYLQNCHISNVTQLKPLLLSQTLSQADT